MSRVSKAEYLKKYLSKDGSGDQDPKTAKKKKKKSKNKVKVTNMKIIDNDVNIGDIQVNSEDDDDEPEEKVAARLGRGEELPTVAGVIDERPMDVIIQEKLTTGEWKPLGGWTEENAPVGTLMEARAQQERQRQRRLRRDFDSNDDDPPRRRRRHDTDDERRDWSPSQQSPPRRIPHDSDSSSERRQRHDSDDKSQPRRGDSVDQSPPRRKQRSKNPSASIRVKRERKDSDASPPRIKREPPSPPPKAVKQEPPDSDESPPPMVKVKREVDSDESPPRRRNSNDDSDAFLPRLMKKTLDGKAAGLQDAEALKKEMVFLRTKEKYMFEKLSDDVSGRGAETKVRGRLKGKEEERKRKKKEHGIPDEVKEKYSRWSKGLKQLEQTKARIEQDLKEMDKPLTRSKDDVDLDEHLKNIEREEDPMLDYIRKKKKKTEDKKGLPAFPQYQGSEAHPNRFNIRPGYRWDGVDRSNGFEKKLFEQINRKMAVTQEAYKWSIEDM